MNENYDPSLKPITPWGYFGYELLFNIPVIGLIFLIVFALGAQNRNVKNFARGHFISLLLVIILCAIASPFFIGAMYR